MFGCCNLVDAILAGDDSTEFLFISGMSIPQECCLVVLWLPMKGEKR